MSSDPGFTVVRHCSFTASRKVGDPQTIISAHMDELVKLPECTTD